MDFNLIGNIVVAILTVKLIGKIYTAIKDRVYQ